MAKYNTRQELAKNLGQQVMLSPKEIDEIRIANRIVAGAVHPDTGEIVPLPMRLSGFVWFNVPLLGVMLFMKTQTPAINAFFQWLNQTYNAGMNYGNRNASTPYTTSDLATGYIGACVSSIGIAMVSRTMFAGKLKAFTGAKFLLLNGLLNYAAAGSAGFLNCLLMRMKESKDGIDITNKTGDVVYGKSREAGKKAVF